MEYSFSNSIFGITDHSLSDDSWSFPRYDSHCIETNHNLQPQLENINNYDSDHSCHSFKNSCNDGVLPKENILQNIPNDSLSFADNEDELGPFSLGSRIPVPGLVPMSRYHMWLETSFMCRRNERERQRVRNVNNGFSRLRNHLPRAANIRRRQSKVETLQHAINYIKHLQSLLGEKKDIDALDSH